MGKPPTFIEPFKSPNLDHEKEAAKHVANPAATKITYIVLVVRDCPGNAGFSKTSARRSASSAVRSLPDSISRGRISSYFH